MKFKSDTETNFLIDVRMYILSIYLEKENNSLKK